MEKYGQEEVEALARVVHDGALWYGKFAETFELEMTAHLGRAYVHGVNSGTSANEAAVAALGVEPGDEVICPAAAPIFVCLPILAAGAIPVFADVDPRTLILDPDAVRACVTERSRAMVVVHLNGVPAPMDALMSVARRHGLQVVEDCAQAYDCFYRGRRVGTFGDVACFSLQESKHMTSGEGGFIATDDPDYYRRAVLYSTCGMPWYRYGLARPDAPWVSGLRTRGHHAFGHNHRMSNLQGAIASVQLRKLSAFTRARAARARAIEEGVRGTVGVSPAHLYPGSEPNYWVYPLRLDAAVIPATAEEVATRLREEHHVSSVGDYHEIAYHEPVFSEIEARRQTPFGYPLPPHVRYVTGLCPGAEAGARRRLMVGMHPTRDLPEVARDMRALVEVVSACRESRSSGCGC